MRVLKYQNLKFRLFITIQKFIKRNFFNVIFSVLRASLHEIKDESFLRKRIEQQPLAVHTTQFPGPDQNEVPTPILPPLRPSLAKKSQTPIKGLFLKNDLKR